MRRVEEIENYLEGHIESKMLPIILEVKELLAMVKKLEKGLQAIAAIGCTDTHENCHACKAKSLLWEKDK